MKENENKIMSELIEEFNFPLKLVLYMLCSQINIIKQ